MFNEPIVFLVDVFDNGILPYSDEGNEVIPVDDCHRASPPKLCCSLNAHREVEYCVEETMVRCRVELCNNSDVGQAKTSIEDDVFEYGPKWHIDHPTSKFIWNSSPFNVKKNGKWSKSDMSEVYQIY
ncbi:hypothetical protein TELCIR_16425 [Teladorsagia circumcincta]|uniref:Uncharacterized protein n=1 Tax=Teladorsagia circumcincta TaxID=45464 RepID=A0A2G9TVJ3_TELCI|nr:hypothetical protein TELCIR_16425 [Teladorsagia circumcincta]